MAKNTAFAELKKDLREGHLKNLYLFYGEEVYLRELYLNKMTESIDDAGFEDMNKIIIRNGRDELGNLSEYLEGFPMMTDRRIIAVCDSGIFKKADDKTKAYFSDFFKKAPDDTIVVFSEDEIDKRGVLYKAISKYGTAVEFAPLNASDTVAWIIREANAKKLKISQQNAELIMNTCDPTLSTLSNELNKLANYCEGEITKPDIERLVSKSLQVKIFDLCDFLIANNADAALALLGELKSSKESAIGVLRLLFSSFDKMFHAKLLSEQGDGNGEIASAIKVAPFFVGKYISGAKGFSEQKLAHMVSYAAETELSIKRGDFDDWTALEQYVYSYFAL